MLNFYLKAITFISLLFSGSVSASLLDLNDFYADPTVTVSADGTSAIMFEDSSLFEVLLSNDPGLGDANVIVPANGSMLSFDYSFSEGVGHVDEFGAFVLDGNTGFSFGPPFEFFTESPGSGNVSFDLSLLLDEFLGFQFQLTSLAGDLGTGSMVEISNLKLVTPISNVPIPSALLLYLSGLFFLTCLKQKSNFQPLWKETKSND